MKKLQFIHGFMKNENIIEAKKFLILLKLKNYLILSNIEMFLFVYEIF
jgi:hypothetical protein